MLWVIVVPGFNGQGGWYKSKKLGKVFADVRMMSWLSGKIFL
jgi:hypothetical protein